MTCARCAMPWGVEAVWGVNLCASCAATCLADVARHVPASAEDWRRLVKRWARGVL